MGVGVAILWSLAWHGWRAARGWGRRVPAQAVMEASQN